MFWRVNMFKTYDLFDHRNINDLVPEIVYYYLFQGLSLTAIEVKLFRTEDYHGWLSKTFLNYYGIDTEKENKGIYAGKTVPEVVDELYRSSNIAHVRVAKLLYVITGTRDWLPCLLLFCIFDYEFIDAVGVFTLRCQFIAILKQALKDEAVFGIG